jgi:hypothetical protein
MDIYDSSAIIYGANALFADTIDILITMSNWNYVNIFSIYQYNLENKTTIQESDPFIQICL